MELKQIKTKITNVSKIYHISDIHIRLLKRHSEYKEVFKRLYKYINETKDENSIICLTGDIVHSKTDMSPECFEMQAELYKNLAKHCPLIIITGNHDCNLSNISRLDSIKPVIDALNHKNIFYWKDTGLYQFADITFSVMSVFDKPEEYIKADAFDSQFKIALFHGPVRTAETDIGYIISEKDMTIQFFDGFDLVLLGDIHKAGQLLNKERTIGYSGSLIQQNFAEDLTHGILVWDIKTKKSEFVPIRNDYGYFTLNIKNGIIVDQNWEAEIPKKSRIRLIIENTTPAEIKTILGSVRHHTKIIEITQRIDKNISNVNTDKFSYENLHDISFQDQLIIQYLSNNHTLDEHLINKLKFINSVTNSKLTQKDSVKNLIWNPVKFEFSNMFSYGENNTIYFKNIKDLYGLFSKNAHGKSSIVSALIFCLFDKSERASKAIHILNNRKNWFSCKLEFEMGGTSYFIERIGKKLPHGAVKVDVEFWQLDEYGEKINLSGQERDETNKIIRSYLGTYEDFILTTVSLQSVNDEFIVSSQRKRNEILARMLDIDIFENLYKIANIDSKDTFNKIKLLQKENFEITLNTAIEQIKDYSVKLKTLEESKAECIKERQICIDEISNLNKQIRHIDDSDNPEMLNNQIAKNEKEFDLLNTKIINCNETIEKLKINISKYEEMRSKIDLKDLKEKYERFLYLKNKIKDVENEKKSINKDIKIIEKKKSQLDKYEYDPNCVYCIKNPFVIDAKTAATELTDLIAKLDKKEQYLTELTNEFISLSTIEKKNEIAQNILTEYNKFITQLNTNNTVLESLKNEVNSKTIYITTLKEKLSRASKNEEYIINNVKLEKQIKNKVDVQKSIDVKLTNIDSEILNLNGKLKVSERNKEIAENKLEELNVLYNEYKAYELYLEATKRDGVPYYLIEQLVPKFQNEINNILNQLVDFAIMIHMDSVSKNIDLYIVYDEERYWPVELTSGMERFITSLAIRVALNNCSNLPRPNFIIIDEGFGVLDADNLSSINLLFDFLKSQFNFILCISHLEVMRDIVDGVIEISKDNDFSQVKHGI